MKYTTKWLVREVAKRAGFAMKDVKLILDTSKEVLSELFMDGNDFIWTGLFKARVNTIAAHRKFSKMLNKEIDVPEKRAIRFKSAFGLSREINADSRIDYGEREE